ncbi:MAG TPA: DUF2971 domain-containing protein [Thermoanaerobaculia bacterium]|jgi:hypothetical protein|nr:DUF2971 domain-containing protein [Thermoanaerobaculia bacterium]
MAEEALPLFQRVLEIAWKNYVVQSPKPDGPLYHYTTADALLNILRARSLWATNLLFTNDPTELSYAESLITRALDDAISACRLSGDSQRCEWLDGFKLSTRRQLERNTWYSVSFCADGDLLPQWRSYGARGGGFAIGWSPVSVLPDNPIRVGIEYEPKRQRDVVDQTIRYHLDHVADHPDIAAPDALDDLTFATGSLGVFFSMFLYGFKHRAFEQEREFRFVYPGFDMNAPEGKALHFRDFGGTIKPYIEADFAQAELLEIVYGPTANAGLTERWLQMALDAYSFKGVKVRPSEVPMR